MKETHSSSSDQTSLSYLDELQKVSQEQRNHAVEIHNRFLQLMMPKYARGCLEHGGNLWEMSALELLDNAIAETVDQFTYLHTLREKLLNDRDK